MKAILLIRVFLILSAACPLTAQTRETGRKVPSIIFDTDMGPDYDDVGALAILHHYAALGRVKILATVSSTRYEGVASVLDVFNTYFHHPEIPLGVAGSRGLEIRDWQHWTDSLLARFPHRVRKNNSVPTSVEIYRRILAVAPDSGVTVITTGFLTNLADLLQSGPDQYSGLDGISLVKKKVRLLVCMGGKFPEGSEFNLQKDPVSSRLVSRQWPTAIIFSGFEIGARIRTGLPMIKNPGLAGSPVRQVFGQCIPMAKEDSLGRCSWDETAVLVAIEGYRPWYRLIPGRLVVGDGGQNSWDSHNRGHYFLQEFLPPEQVRDTLDRLMTWVPGPE
jgi:pyrimidine-specific ribonucleoside hydrolase